MKQSQKHMVNISKYSKALLHSVSGHQESRKAHQAGNKTYFYLMKLSPWSNQPNANVYQLLE